MDTLECIARGSPPEPKRNDQSGALILYVPVITITAGIPASLDYWAGGMGCEDGYVSYFFQPLNPPAEA